MKEDKNRKTFVRISASYLKLSELLRPSFEALNIFVLYKPVKISPTVPGIRNKTSYRDTVVKISILKQTGRKRDWRDVEAGLKRSIAVIRVCPI